MNKKITLCGDNCVECPRYNAHNEEELKKVAELWYKIGLRNTVVPSEEMRCSGCTSDKQCTYHLTECVKEHHVDKCNQCTQFPCQKITDMLERVKSLQAKCEELCTKQEYETLEKAFFYKERYLIE